MSPIRRLALSAVIALLLAVPLPAQQPSPIVRIPGAADRSLDPMSLLGKGERDVRLENTEGDIRVYHGMPLLEVLERYGLDLRTMAGERRSAAAVVLATAREGYTVVFSVGELRENRANPRVFLVSETSTGPLPDNEAPVRLIVYGDVIRSAYGLARIELKWLADNPKPARP